MADLFLLGVRIFIAILAMFLFAGLVGSAIAWATESDPDEE